MKKLALFSLFLPFAPALGVFWYFILTFPPALEQSATNMFGISSLYWWLTFGVAVPLLLGLWLLFSGNWRRPVMTAAVLYCALLGAFWYAITTHQIITPPDKCRITWEQHGLAGADVYCNGVLVGQLPLQIRVKELIDKVPQWNEPPEQSYYEDSYGGTRMTWYPYDTFITERHQEIEALTVFLRSHNADVSAKSDAAIKEAVEKYWAGCKYWWRIESGNKPLAAQFRKSEYVRWYYTSVQVPDYGINANTQPWYPPALLHARILAEAVKDLNEQDKALWDKHVLKHWETLNGLLPYAIGGSQSIAGKEKKRLYAAFESTVRLKYGLSNPPTEEECRKLLKEWMSRDVFDFTNEQRRSQVTTNRAWQSEQFFLERAVKLMGKAVDKPLDELWHSDYYRYPSGYAALVFAASINPEADCFDALLRYAAVTHNGLDTLLNCRDSRVVPLYRTLLYPKSIRSFLEGKRATYMEGLGRFNTVSNPLLEAEYREYIIAALKERDRGVNLPYELLARAVGQSIYMNTIMRSYDYDTAEWADWVASLPLDTHIKTPLVQYVRRYKAEPKTFNDFLFEITGHYRGKAVTEQTSQDILRWFEAHQGETIDKYLQENGKDYTRWKDDPLYSDSSGQYSGNPGRVIDISSSIPAALYIMDTQESRKAIEAMWSKNRMRIYEGVRAALIHRYGEINPYGETALTAEIPDYFLERLTKEPELSFGILLPYIAACESPLAGEVLKKAEEWEAKKVKKEDNLVAYHYRLWQMRQQIQSKQKELYQQLITEKISPSDLLPPRKPHKWNGKEYVRE
ncbi:MAG: hypothetical protein LBT89_01615 [Planctomycetaceae bacterium]|jgi:hypothetical protein|nr:hypothetical protein [Planctomycetaceae bacterium]